MWIEELKPGAAMKEILPHGLATVVELTYKDPSGRPRGAHALHGLGRHGAHGAAVDATRMTRSTGQNAEEVVQHLAGLVGATIRVMIESEADIPDGAPDNVMRTVTENCRTLHFQSFKFEEA